MSKCKYSDCDYNTCGSDYCYYHDRCINHGLKVYLTHEEMALSQQLWGWEQMPKWLNLKVIYATQYMTKDELARLPVDITNVELIDLHEED